MKVGLLEGFPDTVKAPPFPQLNLTIPLVPRGGTEPRTCNVSHPERTVALCTWGACCVKRVNARIPKPNAALVASASIIPTIIAFPFTLGHVRADSDSYLQPPESHIRTIHPRRGEITIIDFLGFDCRPVSEPQPPSLTRVSRTLEGLCHLISSD